MLTASHQYHSGRPRAALGNMLERRSDWEERDWILWLKCLCELDTASEASIAGDQLLRFVQLGWGEVAYWIGVASYIADEPRHRQEAAFNAAASLGFSAAGLGQAFLKFADGAYDDAMGLAQVVSTDDVEYEVINLQIIAQIAIAQGKLKTARRTLIEADKACAQSASMLRLFWQDLSWSRYARQAGQFELSTHLLDRLAARIDPLELPRLHRNLKEAKKFTNARDAGIKIRLPLLSELDSKAESAGLFRKPLLSGLYNCLMNRGDGGASKETLAQELWSESYNPLIHDDRIYKSIARLRVILGDSKKAPKIVIQRGGQYCLQFAESN